jgi:subtilisin-like proprotein convertase family protein
LTNLAGTNVITVTAKDPINNLTTTSSFVFTVLYVNQTPTVTTATNAVYVDENTFKTITYTVGDVDSIIDATNITVTSSDQSLLANSNIVVTGSAVAPGATGPINVKVTPTLNTHGSLTLTFVVSDKNTTATNNLTLNINHIWQQPTISSIVTPQSAVAGSSTTNIAFTVGSVEVSSKNLTVFAKSDNPALVPNSPANIILTGSGNSRFIQLFTIGSASASANITVFVTDNSGNANSTNSTSFVLNATSVANSFANTTAITTSGAGKANLYPSPIAVSGLVGATYKVSVILPNFNHSSPANLDVLLTERGSDNKVNSVVLMSGVGGATAASNLRLTFDDSGVPLPSGPLSSAIYLPGNATKGLVMPAPAPTNTSWSTTLTSAFGGFSPNGTWELYVNDRGAGDVGNIASGWQLVIQTAPTIALHTGTPNPLKFAENTTAQVTLDIADQSIDVSNLVVSATTDNGVLLPVRNITFSGNPKGHSGSVTATLAPAPLQSGNVNVTFVVTRSDGANSSVTLPVVVTPVNVPPTISRLDPISMPENTTSNIVFLVHDDDTPLGNIIVTATTGAGDQGLIANTNLSFVGFNTNRLVGLPSNGSPQTSILTLAVTPQAFKTGTATITITVIDPAAAGTNTVTSSFAVTVTPVIYPPFFITVPGPQSVAAGGTIANIPFAVAHPTDAANTLTVTGSSSDQSLVKDSAIVFGGSGTNRTVTITAQANTPGGTATINLTVTDPATANNFATTNFALTVRPSRVHNYTNSTQITIIDNSAADKYPSQITVNGLAGPISKLTATLNGFTHSFPSDVGVLLAGPTGQKIVLMNNVGGGHPGASNLQLTFDQAASGTIPANGPMATGSFTPFDNSGGLRTFQAPAPGVPYTNTLNGFNGTNPNGTWSIYVEDFSPPDAGAISNGWSLAITTLPVINGLVDVTVPENTAARQNFTVSDDTPSTPIFNFSATSDNQSVVTNAGVVFTGSGTNWTVTVNPVANVSGSANITVTMVNGDGQTVTSKFKATFTPVEYAPVIDPIADRSIASGTSDSVTLNYSNIGFTPDQLTVTFGSSNTNLVPVANMKLVGNQLLISPVGVQQGTSTIKVTVTNPNPTNNTTSTSFKLTVFPNPTPVFAASGTIVINDNAAASPYPSTINVSGLNGKIAGVTATFVGFGHGFPADVSALLVGPQGQTVVLISRAGGSATVTNTRITFDDNATASLPQFTLITDGTYKPTDYKVSDTFFPPAPVAPYAHALSAFNGTDPNGTWSLYVQDDQVLESGIITGGWVLAITTTGPSISNPGPTTIAENSVSNVIPFSVSSTTVNASNLVVTATNTVNNPAGIISSLTLGGSGTSRFIVVTPGHNLPSSVTTNNGSSTITLTVTDGSLTNSVFFPLTVSYVNQPPTVTGLTDQTTPANVPVSVVFTVTDVDSDVNKMVITTSTSNASLGTAAVTSNGGGTNTLTYTPKNVTGTNIVTVKVNDGFNTVTNSFAVVITAGLPPVLGAIAPQSTPVNTVKSFPLNVTPLSGIPGFQYSGTSTNSALLKNVTFTISATNVVANLNIVSNMVGFDQVTIKVSDATTNSSQTFALTVTPTGVVTMGPIGTQTTTFNVNKSVALTAASPDTAANNLHYTGSHTNAFLVSGFTFAYNGRNEVATINLFTNRAGDDFITISVTDGFSTASQSFVLHVTGTPPNQSPVLTLSSSGGKLTLNLKGSPNTGYTIQGATSLSLLNWSTITNLTSDASGNASFSATPSPSVPVQFIRAKSP